MTFERRQMALELFQKAEVTVVSSVAEDGFPNAKAMYVCTRDDMKTHYFSTNTSSVRAAQFMKNEKACLYFQDKLCGLMLVGTMEICTDREHKQMLWTEGDEKYYPLGVDDPDYCVLKFTARRGNFYYHFEKDEFEIEELL